MRTTLIAAAFLAGGSALGAQACKYSMNDAWVKRQAEYFDDAKGGWSNDTLRTALLSAAGLTAPLKVPVQLGVAIQGRDKPLGPNAGPVTAELVKLAAVRGSAWPTKSVVGAAGTHAVYLLAQQDTSLFKAIHRPMEAGPAESPAIDVAMWEDRFRLRAGRKQIYGTQFVVDEKGKVTLAPMEDSAHADLRREGAGLPPLKLGMCFARQEVSAKK
jgi:hypothetical protein